ncbi:MAG: hypothetical protein A2036_00210 [Omnitrophica bacterium GWA2_50_21]|nr:MAG: hypothetical protein A2036_00210 [Omnitrophica bacterium GWA2_50_21]
MHKKARFMIFSLVFVFILGLHSYAFAKPEGKGKGPGGGSAPYGWSQGKKTGWNNADMPPGLAKEHVPAVADKMKSKPQKKEKKAKK